MFRCHGDLPKSPKSLRMWAVGLKSYSQKAWCVFVCSIYSVTVCFTLGLLISDRLSETLFSLLIANDRFHLRWKVWVLVPILSAIRHRLISCKVSRQTFAVVAFRLSCCQLSVQFPKARDEGRVWWRERRQQVTCKGRPACWKCCFLVREGFSSDTLKEKGNQRDEAS